jgi:hypothetical protein
MRHPADVTICLKAPTPTNSTTVAIDVTFAAVPLHLCSRPKSNQPTSLHQAHLSKVFAPSSSVTPTTQSPASTSSPPLTLNALKIYSGRLFIAVELLTLTLLIYESSG